MSNVNGRRRQRHPRQRHPDEQRLVQAAEASAGLRQLLAAASAPPSAAELKGRSQAIADFRAVHRAAIGAQPSAPATGQPVSERRTPPKLARVGRWSAARLTVACAALVVLLGGTAAAAAAGELPTALQNAVSDLLNPSAGVGPPPTPDRSSAVPTAQPTPGSAHAGSSLVPNGPPTTGAGPGSVAGRPGAAAAGPPQLAALCRSYRAADSPAAMLTRPAFAPLVTAADGVAGVPGFCGRLAGPARTAPPSVRPPSPDSVSPRPAHSQRAGSQRAGSQPAGSQPARSQPAGSQPAGSQPARSQPARSHPARSQPAGSQPAGSQPARSQPAGSQPAGSQPAGSQPARSHPARSQLAHPYQPARTRRVGVTTPAAECPSQLRRVASRQRTGFNSCH